MIRPIYLYGAEVLRKKAQEADLGNKEAIAALVQDLKDTLLRADGCGLAAPQIGESVRVVIVDGDVVSDNYPYLTSVASPWDCLSEEYDENLRCVGVSMNGVNYLCAKGYSAEDALLYYLPDFSVSS